MGCAPIWAKRENIGKRSATMKRIKPDTDTTAAPIMLPKYEVSKDVVLVDRSGPSPSLTDAGCEVVRAMAAELFTQEEIAATLGLSGRQFKTLLGKSNLDPMSPARAAWETGHAQNKGELLRIAMHAARRGAMVQTLFLLKAEHGLRDQGPSVIVDAGAKIQFTLHGSYSPEAYLKEVGCVGAIDSRDPQRRQIVFGSESPEHKFGVYQDGTPVPDYGGMRMLPASSNPSLTSKEQSHAEQSEN
jgi:DNA-binding CsgD family transcriptional regulator